MSYFLPHNFLDGNLTFLIKTEGGGEARSTAALYHPCMRYHASWIRGRSALTSASTFAPASSALCFWYAARLAFTALPSCCLNARPYRGSWRADTLSLTSLYVSSKIQAFCLASRGCAFGTDLHRAAKSLSTRVDFSGDLAGHRSSPI